MPQPALPEIPRDAAMTTQEYAYLRLRNAVMTGALQPGTALTFRGLAEQLDLSPTPIREALRRLSSENAIKVLGNRRLRVPEMTAGRFEELVQLRIALETHAAMRAFPYISDVAIAHLTTLDDGMDKALAERDLDALTRMNQEFHKVLYGLNPDQAALPLIESIWLQLGPFQRQVIEHLDDFAGADHHKEMLVAMRNRDLSALCSAIENDVRDGSIRAGRRMLQDTGT
ncbi:GntR family transcriptional regulator [Paracoccus lutimaris]|uniref:GntR family transcriptional regulator n=1 Tax=Paracoccus lutimaris TaxID=1490030 RepID=A0A368YKR6_9RHOB|nr:GntR family transcriptional regulator [Paracoccus lutimaris]RCW80765.1 GntR family transcriptional regulator [Paracoccus lutimaris]